MILPNRSPGYLYGQQTETMTWPDLRLVPHLKDLNLDKPDDSFCEGLEDALRAPDRQRVISQLNKLHKRIRKEIGDASHLQSFFSRFPQEYDREREAMQKRKNKAEFEDLSEDGKHLVLNGFFVKALPENKITQIREQMQGDIDKLLEKPPIRTRRNYDRSINYTGGPNLNLVNQTLREGGMIDAAEEYFGFSMSVKLVVLHISFPDDTHFNQVLSDISYSPKTCGLHFDPKSGTIKSLLYLKNITEDDGPFTYLPRTHNFINPPLQRLSAKSNCTTNYLDSPQARGSFVKLPNKMRKTSIFGTVTDDSDELSARLLEREKSFLSADGNVIVFDPGMFHRGGICKSGHRISLQIAIR